MTPFNDGQPNLRVAHVVLSLDVGGLERVVVDLVRQGQVLGQQVAVVCVEQPGQLALQLQRLGVTVRCAWKPFGLKWSTVGTLQGLLGGLQLDVVHTHQVGALFYAGPAARRLGIPAVIHTEHGKHYAARWRTRWLGRLAFRYAHRFIAVNQDIADEAVACRVVRRSKVHVVHNGIDLAPFTKRCAEDQAGLRHELGIPTDANIIGTVGRLDEIKRQDLLIRAAARLHERGQQIHLLLVGDGPRSEELKALAVEVGAASYVHFVGYQSQPERYLQLMDVFALTSRSEGMPLAVLEAWAAGVPVVASRVGGLPALIEEGQTGLLFPAGDEAALVETLNTLLHDTELCRQLRASGKERVAAEFTVERMAAVYQGHYREVLEQVGRGGSTRLVQPVGAGR